MKVNKMNIYFLMKLINHLIKKRAPISFAALWEHN